MLARSMKPLPICNKKCKELLPEKETERLYSEYWELKPAPGTSKDEVPKLFKCQECGKSYSSTSVLNRHKKKKHHSVKESDTQAKEADTQVKESDTQAKEADTQVKESDTQAKGADTQVKESDTQAKEADT
jgi:C2H2-type zinc finger